MPSLEGQAEGHGPLTAPIQKRIVTDIGETVHSTERPGPLYLHADLGLDRGQQERIIGTATGNQKAFDLMAAKGHRVVSDTQGDLPRQRLRHASQGIGEHSIDRRIEGFRMTL